MVRYYVLYDGDDLETEREKILNEVINPIKNKVEKSGKTFEFRESFLDLQDNEKNTEFDRMWLYNVCNDENNDCKPHFILVVGDKCGFVKDSNNNKFKMLNFVDYIQKIKETANLTILVSNTVSKSNLLNEVHETNQDYKMMFFLYFLENTIIYKRAFNKNYKNEINKSLEKDFEINLYEKSMNYLKDVIKDDYSLNLEFVFNEEDRKKYEETKKEKLEMMNKIHFLQSYNYYNFVLSSAIYFEKLIFENENSAKLYIEKSNKEFRHWRKAFSKLKVEEKEICESTFKNIGKFICKNFDKIEIQKFLYHSTFFKCIAIDYAYSTGENELAEKIIYLGYDRYFEFETLYLMKKYNEKLFYEEIKKLKKICFKRNLYEYYKGYSSWETYKLYGNEFSEEFYKLAKQMIKKIENAPDDDPRKNEEHIIPDWAK